MRARRDLAIFLVMLCTAGVAGAQRPVIVDTIGPSEWVLRLAPGGNVLVAILERETVLVDAQSANAVPQILGAVRGLSTFPIHAIINTHYHEDHVGGNSDARASGTVVVGHTNLGSRAVVDTIIAELDWHREAANASDLPDVAIARDTVIANDIRVLPFAPAHTDGDLVVYFPRENVLHVGDIVEVSAYPFIDWWAGGTLHGMIDAVDRLLEIANDSTRIVPGHGPVIDRADLESYRLMLDVVHTSLSGLAEQGASLEEALATGPTDEFDGERGGPRRGASFVRLLYPQVQRRHGQW